MQWLCPFPSNNTQVPGMYALKIAWQLTVSEPGKETHKHVYAYCTYKHACNSPPQDEHLKEHYTE